MKRQNDRWTFFDFHKAPSLYKRKHFVSKIVMPLHVWSFPVSIYHRFFWNQDLWQKWYVTPLDASLFTDRLFQKKKLSSRWCYLYITLLIVEQCIWTTEKTDFPVSVRTDRSMILQTLDSRTGNEVNYCKYRLILSFRMRWFNRAQMIALGSIETQSFCLYCGTGRNWCCNRSLFFSK